MVAELHGCWQGVTRALYPRASALRLSAFASELNLLGESPGQEDEFDPVVDRNCVTARWGGEHRKAKGQSETKVNSMRPFHRGEPAVHGEADVPYVS